MTRSFNCPKCGKSFVSNVNGQSSKCKCPNCGVLFALNEQGQTSLLVGESDIIAEPYGLLDELEDLLFKMIKGIFRFVFVRLPWEIYSAITRWFPTAIKVCKVLLLFATWLLLTTGSIIWVVGNSWLVRPDSKPFFQFYYDNRTLCDVLLCSWTVLALAGSVWGIVHQRRKHGLLRFGSNFWLSLMGAGLLLSTAAGIGIAILFLVTQAKTADNVSPNVIASEKLVVANKVADQKASKLDADHVCDEAVVAANQGNYAKALALSDKAIQIDPQYYRAYGCRGLAYYLKGQFELALADLDKAIRINPVYYYGFGNRAHVHLMTKDSDKAIADCTAAIRINPKGAFAYGIRGEAYRLRSQYSLCIDDCTEAIRLDPNSALAFAVRGAAWKSQNWLDQALTDLTEAIRLNPTYVWAYLQRSEVHQALGFEIRSMADFEEAVRLDPKLALSRLQKQKL